MSSMVLNMFVKVGCECIIEVMRVSVDPILKSSLSYLSSKPTLPSFFKYFFNVLVS